MMMMIIIKEMAACCTTVDNANQSPLPGLGQGYNVTCWSRDTSRVSSTVTTIYSLDLYSSQSGATMSQSAGNVSSPSCHVIVKGSGELQPLLSRAVIGDLTAR